jgi:aspartyl-tRNA(Asn)/glutamyl-tRNA(Gln) amidotransferase subunit C
VDLTEKDVDHVCRLAKLRVSSEGRGRLLEDLKEILEFVRRLREVDTEGVEPVELRDPAEKRAAREDRREQGLDREDVMRAAPDALRGHFRVPRVL